MSRKVLDVKPPVFTGAIKFIKRKADKKKGVRDVHEDAKVESKPKGVAKKKFKVTGKGGKLKLIPLPRNLGRKLREIRRNKLLNIVKTNVEKVETPETSGVVMLSHLPEGFTDETLAEYFGQFGEVTVATICRSAKTGRSKGYAFIEFVVPEVAQIAADTMNNYILGKRLLKAEVVPKSHQVAVALWTKYRENKYPGLKRRQEHFDNFNFSGGDSGKNKVFQLNSEEFKVRGMPYTFKPKEDTVTSCIETIWDEMKAMTKEQIAAEDKTNEVLIKKKKKNVPSKDLKKLISLKKQKKQISSKKEKKQISSKKEKEQISSKKEKEQISSKKEKEQISSKKEKKQISSKKQKKQVLVKYQKDDVSEDRKKVVPSCSDSDKLVLEVDESDDEIEFKTPPNVIKKRLKCIKT